MLNDRVVSESRCLLASGVPSHHSSYTASPFVVQLMMIYLLYIIGLLIVHFVQHCPVWHQVEGGAAGKKHTQHINSLQLCVSSKLLHLNCICVENTRLSYKPGNTKHNYIDLCTSFATKSTNRHGVWRTP